jgi:hypothetical protein
MKKRLPNLINGPNKIYRTKMIIELYNQHSWASASKPMTTRHRFSGIHHLSPVPDWVPLLRYRTGSGIGIYFHSGTGLTG